MRRKHNLSIFLITGISFLIFLSCQRKDDISKLRVQFGTFSYVNGLYDTLQFEVHDGIVGKVYTKVIPPNKKFTYTEKSADIGAYANPFFGYSEGEKIEGDTVIIRFRERCTYYRRHGFFTPQLGDGVFDYKNYDNFSSNTLSQEQFSLTYTIDSLDFNLSNQCE